MQDLHHQVSRASGEAVVQVGFVYDRKEVILLVGVSRDLNGPQVQHVHQNNNTCRWTTGLQGKSKKQRHGWRGTAVDQLLTCGPRQPWQRKAAMANAGGRPLPPAPQEEGHWTPPDQEQDRRGGESLLQRILRLAREGPVCSTSTPASTPDPTPRAPSPQPSSRTLSSTSEPEVIDVQLQYDESSRLQNQHLALRPKAKARPKVRQDPQHGAMAAGGDDGDRPAPESEDEGEDEGDVEETEAPEYMVRMKQQSDWLTQGGKRNWAQAGKSSASLPQKLRRSKGHTVLWWQRVYGKGKQPQCSDHEPGGKKLWWKGRTSRPWRWSTPSCRNTTCSGGDKGGWSHPHSRSRLSSTTATTAPQQKQPTMRQKQRWSH